MTSATVKGVTSRYTYAGASQNQLLTETTDGEDGYTYTYGKTDRAGVPEIVSETSGGTTSQVLSDAATGQALDLTDSDGDTAAFLVDGIGNQVGALTDAGSNAFHASYDPYGTGGVTSGNTSKFWTENPYGFKAGDRTNNQNGIVKFGLRWYNPSLGSWTQEDTLDAPLDPSNANRYVFAAGDPINGSDPSGNDFLGTSCASEIGLGAIGFVGGLAELGLEGFTGVVSAAPTLGLGTAAAGGLAVASAGVVAGGVYLIGDGINSCS